MLGRLLWCIYEGVPAPEEPVWVSYVGQQRNLEFPDYERTPKRMRVIIDACTKGRKEWEQRLPVVRKGDELVFRRREGDSVVFERDAEIIEREATRWWKKELTEACDFLKERANTEKSSNRNWFGRPTLEEVLNMLKLYPS